MIGTVSQFVGKSTIVAKGQDNIIEVGPNVRFRDLRIEFPFGRGTVRIGDNVQVRGFIQVAAGSTVEIGANTFFNRNCHLSAWEGASIRIGHDCLFSNVAIRTSDMHSIIDLKSGKRINAAQDTVIEPKVWLGESVTVYKGVTVGSGSIVGGNSVVTRSVPRNVAVAGVPARVLRRGVIWDRAALPIPPGPARPAPATWALASKEDMADQLKSGEAQKLISEVGYYLEEHGLDLAEIDTYAQFYYAKARYICCEFTEARNLLEGFVQRNPRHKAAQDLLNEILALNEVSAGR